MIKIKKNITTFEQMADLAHDVNQLLEEGQTFTVYVCDKKPTRSIQQNKYYWGIVIDCISSHLGYEPSEVHELMKYMFNYKRYKKVDGTRMQVGQSTAKLNKQEFSLYVEQIIGWAADEMNLHIPSTQELEEQQLIEKGII